MANKAEMLIEELEPLAAEHELELVTVEIAGTRKNPVLRVYMDTLAGGITLLVLRRRRGGVPLLLGGIVLLLAAAAFALYLAATLLLVLAVR